MILLILLGGCRSVHDVEILRVHDTLRIVSADTLKEVKYLQKADTAKTIEKHYYTLATNGDTTKEVHYYHHTEKTIVVDSTDRYKSKVDSLQRIVKELKDKTKTVVKEQSWWDKFKCRAAFIFALCCVVILLWVSCKDKIRKWLRTKI